MKLVPAALALALLAAPALAQQTEEEARAAATVRPMIAELVADARQAEVMTLCIVAAAEPAERAGLAAAAGPSQETAAVVNAVLARPGTIGCIQNALQ